MLLKFLNFLNLFRIHFIVLSRTVWYTLITFKLIKTLFTEGSIHYILCNGFNTITPIISLAIWYMTTLQSQGFTYDNTRLCYAKQS